YQTRPHRIAANPRMRLDVNLAQRREAVEAHRAVGGRVGARAHHLDLVAHGEIERQLVAGLLVEHIDFVASGAREDYFSNRLAVAQRAQPVLDGLIHGLGRAAELADVEITPALLVLGALLRDQPPLGLDDAGVAGHAPPRLDDELRDFIAEMLDDRLHDGLAV